MVNNDEAVGLMASPRLSMKGSLDKKKKQPAQLSRLLFLSQALTHFDEASRSFQTRTSISGELFNALHLKRRAPGQGSN
jgi:hypothetical protein